PAQCSEVLSCRTGYPTFAQTNNCPGVLLPRAQCTITLSFGGSPFSAFSSGTGQLKVAAFTAASPYIVSLTGSVYASTPTAPPTPRLAIIGPRVLATAISTPQPSRTPTPSVTTTP